MANEFYLNECKKRLRTDLMPDEFHLTIIEMGEELTDEIKAEITTVLSSPSKIHLYINDLNAVTVKTNVVELHTTEAHPVV